MNFHALRQEPLPSALTTTRECRPAAFRAHPCAKTMLVFPGALRALECAFHDVGRLKSAYTTGDHRLVNPGALWNNQSPTMSEVVIEPAVFEDLDELSNLLGELFSEEKDFRPDKQKQLQGLRLIFEEPNRGRVFVLRRDRTIVGMINLLFTISTAEGGFVILLEDLVVHDSFRGHGYGSKLLEYAINFAKQKKFLRITLLTDRPELRSQNFFKRHGFFESHMLPMRLLISQDTSSPTKL
jgi:GNAT superfamily N-acetyltransferase